MANHHRWLPDLGVRRYPNAVTIGDLIAEHMGLGVQTKSTLSHLHAVGPTRCLKSVSGNPAFWP